MDTIKPFFNLTDASNTGVGTTLLQRHPTEKKMNVISNNSRLFTPIEMLLSTLMRNDQQLLLL